jgi:hypothetical protein
VEDVLQQQLGFTAQQRAELLEGAVMWAAPFGAGADNLTVMVMFSSIDKKRLVLRQRQRMAWQNPDQSTPKIWHYWTPAQQAFWKHLWPSYSTALDQQRAGGSIVSFDHVHMTFQVAGKAPTAPDHIQAKAMGRAPSGGEWPNPPAAPAAT